MAENSDFLPKPKIRYMDDVSLVNFNTVNPSGVSLFYINMRSVVHRWTLFETYLKSMPQSSDVIVISETWLFEHETKFYGLQDYDAFHSTRPLSSGRGRGGGIAVFVKT